MKVTNASRVVQNNEFPTEDHSYAMGADLQESLEEWKKEIKKILS